jgi:hypothetical protein
MAPNAHRKKLEELQELQQCALLSPTSFLGSSQPQPPPNAYYISSGSGSAESVSVSVSSQTQIVPILTVHDDVSRPLSITGKNSQQPIMVSSPNINILRRSSPSSEKHPHPQQPAEKSQSKHTVTTHHMNLNGSSASLDQNQNKHHVSQAEFSSLALPPNMMPLARGSGIPLPAASHLPLIPPRMMGMGMSGIAPGTGTHTHLCVHMQHNIHHGPGARTGVTNHRDHDATFYRDPRNHIHSFPNHPHPNQLPPQTPQTTHQAPHPHQAPHSCPGYAPFPIYQVNSHHSTAANTSNPHKNSNSARKTLTETVRAGAWIVGSMEGATSKANGNGKSSAAGPGAASTAAAGMPPTHHTPSVEMMIVDGTGVSSMVLSTCDDDQNNTTMSSPPNNNNKHGKKRTSNSPSLGFKSLVLGSNHSHGPGSTGSHWPGGVPSVVHTTHDVSATPAPAVAPAVVAGNNANPFQSYYEDKLFHRPNTSAVEAVLSAACEGMGFDIAEMWLRTGQKTHQLIHSHVRPTAMEERVAAELVEVYYGERSCERTHRLSPALCKRAKEASDVVWVTAHTPHGADALKCSISDVRTAVAIPVCHLGSNTNMTLIFFSIKRAMMKPPAVEFLVHMSLSSATVSVNIFADMFDTEQAPPIVPVAGQALEAQAQHSQGQAQAVGPTHIGIGNGAPVSSQSQHMTSDDNNNTYQTLLPVMGRAHLSRAPTLSVSGAKLDMKWADLSNVEYLTDGGNNWIHTAVVAGKPVVVKTLKPECQDVMLAIYELESELQIHSRLQHQHICQLLGAGLTSKGNRFVVLERLDGGTLAQVLGYDTRIRDRRRRFWRRKAFSYGEVLGHGRALADALSYCQARAVVGGMVLHRDLKPDNVGFTLDGTLKLLDFGLGRVVDNASPYSEDTYQMSGETGSLRYMAPEVTSNQPYNHKADVYSFGVILWELLTKKKPYEGMNRSLLYERVIMGGERPLLNKKWPRDLSTLLQDCWSPTIAHRPNFEQVVERLDQMLRKEHGTTGTVSSGAGGASGNGNGTHPPSYGHVGSGSGGQRSTPPIREASPSNHTNQSNASASNHGQSRSQSDRKINHQTNSNTISSNNTISSSRHNHNPKKPKSSLTSKSFSSLIERHSSWF